MTGCAKFFFFFNDTATTEIYTLSLHDALPISYYNTALVRYIDFMDNFMATGETCHPSDNLASVLAAAEYANLSGRDRKSTRLNSSHLVISYAVFCLKKKKYTNINMTSPYRTQK